MKDSFNWKQAYQDLASLIALSDIRVSSNIQETFAPFLQKLRQILNFNAIALFLYDEKSEHLFVCEYQYSFEPYLNQTHFYSTVSEIYHWVLNKGTSVYFPSEIAPGLNDLYVPLTLFESRLGLLHIITEADPLEVTQHQNTVLTIFAHQVSRSLQYLKALRKEKENYENLVQYEKINLLGYVLSGVIHEINSPLTAVIGYSSLMVENIAKLSQEALLAEPLKELKELTGLLNKESSRASTIVKSLLKYVRKTDSDEEKSVVNVHNIILNCLDLMQYNLKIKHISVETQLGASQPLVLGDMIQLQQAFFNVLTNAEQALSEESLLQASATSFGISIRSWMEQGSLMISIKDNGKGIPPQYVTRIFDPFFTTKEVGKGTGLGLSLCYKIMAEHNGKLWAENHPSGGAEFFFKLPVINAENFQTITKRRGLPNKRLDKAIHKQAKILIIDDEVTIIHLLRKILTRDGYLVESCGTIEEAKQKLLKEDIHVLIVDIHLQDGSGRTLYEWVETQYPALSRSVIFLTGAISNATVRQFMLDKHLKCLFKPFFPKELLAAVQQVLQG